MNKVGPANLFLQALMCFSKKLRYKTNPYNPYQAYIQTLINSGQDTLSNKTLILWESLITLGLITDCLFQSV